MQPSLPALLTHPTVDHVPDLGPGIPQRRPGSVTAVRNLDRSLGDGGMELLGLLGLHFDSYSEGRASATWTPTELASNPLGAVHGGVYGVIHDAAMNFATTAALSSGDRCATLDLSYATLRPAKPGDKLTVKGTVVRAAKSVAWVESTVHDADGELVSKGTATFSLRRKES